MRTTIVLLILCLSIVHVTSHLRGFRGGDTWLTPFRPGGSFNEAMWTDRDRLMGFPTHTLGFTSQPMLHEFQRWSRPRDWHHSWNNNNFIPGVGRHIDPMFSNNANPWITDHQFNSGLNSIFDRTSPHLATSPINPSRNQPPGINAGNDQWSIFERHSRQAQPFPIIPSPGGFVRPNVGNNMFRNNNGLVNRQFPASGFQPNGDPFSQNLGLRNDQFQWLK